jgi:tetratricopeptide (TPR) repeat protein
MSEDTKKTAEMLKEIASLASSGANSYEELVSRGDAYLALGCAEEALRDYDHAIGLKREELDAHIKRFSILIRLDLIDRMLDAANEILALTPKQSIGYFHLGIALATLGREEESVEAYTKAIELTPRAPAAYINRSAGYSALGFMDKCLADCEKALSLDHKLVSARINKALALRCLGEQEKAIKVCNEAIAIEASPLAYCNRAMANFALNKDKQAMDDANLSIKFAKQPVYVAKCKAIKAKFLADAGGGGGGGNSGDDQRRRLDEARQLCDSAVRVAPKNSHPWRYAWSTSALISGMMGDFEAANRNVQLVLDHNKGFIYGVNIKARLLLMQERLDEALIAINTALTLNPKDPESNFIRYQIRKKKGDAKATEDLKRARDLGYLREDS